MNNVDIELKYPKNTSLPLQTLDTTLRTYSASLMLHACCAQNCEIRRGFSSHNNMIIDKIFFYSHNLSYILPFS